VDNIGYIDIHIGIPEQLHPGRGVEEPKIDFMITADNARAIERR
jgi:hypothetical protein